MCASPTRASASARRRRATAISTSRPCSRPARSPAPTRCIRATASCPRTRASPRSSRATTSPSSAPRPSTSASWATRSRPSAPPSASASPACPAPKAASPTMTTRCAIAAEIGYPVLVKAAAGGGGRGMKVARTEDDLVDALPDRPHRGQGGLRRRRRLSREIPGEAAPHRVPGARRRPRRRDASRRARLLAAAPPPEGLGGRPLPGAQRRACARSIGDIVAKAMQELGNMPAPARSSSSTRTASSTSSR